MPRTSWTVVALLVIMSAVPLRAELRIRSTVEVKQGRQITPGLFAQLAFLVVRPRVALGRAEVTTTAARGAVRTEGLGPVIGLPAETVLIALPDGRTAGLLPSRTEYFWLPVVDQEIFAKFISHESTVKNHGPSEVYLGQPTARVTAALTMAPVLPDDGKAWDERSGRMVDEWTIAGTPEDRSRRVAARSRGQQESYAHEPVTIETWLTDAYGPIARQVAVSRATMTWFATAGLAPTDEPGLPMRQIIRHPAYGFQLESRVQAVEVIVVGDDVFQIPAHYRETAVPRSPTP